jgi:hypothetical protein
MHAKLIVVGEEVWIHADTHIDRAEPQPRDNWGIVIHRCVSRRRSRLVLYVHARLRDVLVLSLI